LTKELLTEQETT